MDNEPKQIRGLKLWAICLILALPSLIPLTLHFYFSATVAADHPTGFIQTDQAYYMANARQYFDGDTISFTHKNPCDWRSESPAIYFQPQTFLLGVLREVTRLDPAILFNLFGFLFAVLAIRVAWSLLGEYVRSSSLFVLIFVLFLWGGGLFSIAGVVTMLLAPVADLSIYDYLTRYDPFGGWWFLNLGRNFVFPMECFYHFLFLTAALLLARGKHWLAVLTAFALSISHPFTGVELLAIVFCWFFLERVFWQRKEIQWSLVVASGGLLLLHVAYYQVWLNGFPAHRELHEVWELDWEYKAPSMLLGYGIVACLAAFTIRNVDQFQKFFSQASNRLLFVWFAVAFLLANHEFFMKSVQPLHFTRGYVWTPLFLAGAATLARMFKWLSVNGRIPMVVPILILLFLLDNMAWLCVSQIDAQYNSLHTKTDFRKVMQSVDELPQSCVMVSNSRHMSYLTTVYTQHDSFVSHGYLTPDVDTSWESVGELFQNGTLIDNLSGYRQLILIDRHGSFLEDPGDVESVAVRLQSAYESAGYSVSSVAKDDDFSILLCLPDGQ